MSLCSETKLSIFITTHVTRQRMIQKITWGLWEHRNKVLCEDNNIYYLAEIKVINKEFERKQELSLDKLPDSHADMLNGISHQLQGKG